MGFIQSVLKRKQLVIPELHITKTNTRKTIGWEELMGDTPVEDEFYKLDTFFYD